MAEHLNSLESLQALHTELLALSESRLKAVDRLDSLIQAHIEAFRALLDKKTRNEQSRKSIETGKLEIPDENDDYATYEINADFQLGALQLADELDLDEVQAALIFWEGRRDADASGRAILSDCVIRFHQRRKYLLDSLRIILELQANPDLANGLRDGLKAYIQSIVRPPNARDKSSRYAARCISGMGDIKYWLQKVAEKVNTASVLGNRDQNSELLEIMEYQRVSLVQQHECLGVVVEYLVKTYYSDIADFESLLETLKKAEKYDNLLVHHFPAFGAYVSRFGSPEGGGGSQEDARALHAKIFKQSEQNPWTLNYVYAACRAWWLAEYSGWYGDSYDTSIPGVNIEEESEQRSKQFSNALKDGAFDFLLALSADVKSSDWYDPARHGLRIWLVRKPMSGHTILPDNIPFSAFFQEGLMEQVETLIESFITNLPDVLRKLRIDEDEQRQLSHEHEHDLDLERFLVIISYAFEGRPKAAFEGFWDVPDGAFFGFLQWASRRASTPLVSAFCEMLQALSGDEDCANAAHRFLLDDAAHSARMRRTHALNWSQIFKELTFFSNKIRDQPVLQPQAYRSGKAYPDPAELEPESTLMLESYLRLITRMCTESTDARTYLISNPSFQVTELLLQLASSSIPSRLRACAFTTLRSLLTYKSRNLGEQLWIMIDLWITSGFVPGTNKNAAPPITNPSSPGAILRKFSTGFEEPNALAQLLSALVSPYEEAGLFDGLPFPEILGAANRMPGIDPYVDFALGHVFGARFTEVNDPAQLRLLQLTCLDFIATCLTTFNEDLLVFANVSNVKVDTAIKTSSLQQYVVLHPFARVMEWMFNANVMKALFSAAHQDISEVANAPTDSPLILCLLQSMNVITLAMKLQATYMDIVRPLVKKHRGHKQVPVANTAFASFEDGILNHLGIIPDLGLYCGSGHPELVVASLKLLEVLCASPTLTASREGSSRRVGQNRAIAALEASESVETISRSLMREMEVELEGNEGAESPGYIIKLKILDLLGTCLLSSPSSPTVAHLLLGFDCSNNTIQPDPSPESPFNQGISLFHSILDLAIGLPLLDESGINIPFWQVSLQYKCLQLLAQLWRSPLSSELILSIMLSNGVVFNLLVKQVPIQPGMLWDGCDPADPEFLLRPAAASLCHFLSQRSLAFEYISAELRQVARSHAPTLQKRILEALLGSTSTDAGQVQNASVFDLLEFMDININHPLQCPKLSWFPDINISICLEDQDDPDSPCNIAKLKEHLALRRAELQNTGHLENPQDVILVESQSGDLVIFYEVDNQIKQFWQARLKTLRAWVQLLIVMIETSNFDSMAKVSFVLQILQAVLPRLEGNLEVVAEVEALANLVKAAIFSLKIDTESFKKNDIGDLVSERLLNVFQFCLKAAVSIGANATLKEIFYSISFQYLTIMSDNAVVSITNRRNSTQTVKSAGERLMDVICDDALAGEPGCRMAALLFLGALVKLSRQENSKYVVESLVRLNFISILVQSIQTIPTELAHSSKDNFDIHFTHINARLSLLTHISQTRFGATVVLNSSLFLSIKASGLFAVDPELDVDLDDPTAIAKHYHLLTSLMRLICATVLSRGTQNEQTIDQGRKFLTENRTSMLGVLKRAAGRSTGMEVARQSVEELADGFLLLVGVVGYLDFEDKAIPKKPATNLMTFT